jgi:hypothetical protein
VNRLLAQAISSTVQELRSVGGCLLRLADGIAVAPLPPSFLSSSERLLLLKNGAFEHRHAGVRCFILGNGPSLRRHELRPLAGEITFVSNGFYRHDILDRWQPTYYCLIDPLFFDDSPMARDYLDGIRRRATAPVFFVPLYFHTHLPTVTLTNEGRCLPPDQTFFLALEGDVALRPVTRLDPRFALPPLLNVTQVCLALAIFMGCSPIYLLGLDHDWLAHPGAEAHFYSQTEAPELEHEYVRRLRATRCLYRRMLDGHIRTWSGYELLADQARRQGVRIVNLTQGGFLDRFERASYSDVVHP